MTTTATKRHQLLIGSERGAAAGGAPFEDVDPSTGETFAMVSSGGVEDADRRSPPPAPRFPPGSGRLPERDRGSFWRPTEPRLRGSFNW